MATNIGTVNERSTTRYRVTLKDIDGNVIPTLDSLTLTVKTKTLGTVVNGRNNQNALNANNVTYSGVTGLIEWNMQQLDNAIVDVGGEDPEARLVTFSAIWNSGAGRETWEFEYTADDLADITS